ncbi:MAG: glycosyltransferase family 39 protein [Bacteroidia bacterium]
MPLRTDEGYTMASISSGFLLAIKRAVVFENYPPLYFGLLAIWSIISKSYFWGRMFSVLSITGAALLIPELGKRYLPKVAPVWMVCALSLNPMVIVHQVDMRCYAFLIFLSAISLILFYDGYLSENPNRKARWFYILVAVISLYTHYFSGFLLAANGAVLVVTQNWKMVKNYLLDMIIPAIALAALIPFIPGQFENQHHEADSGTLGSTIIFSIKVVESFLLETDAVSPIPEFLKNSLPLLIAGILLFALTLNIKELKYFFRSEERYIVIIFCCLLLFISAIFFLFGRSVAQLKYIIFLSIPTIFLFFYALSLKDRKWMIPVGGGILMTSYFIITPLQFFPPIKTEDYKAVGAYLEEKAKPGEPILVFENIHELVLKHHYNGQNQLYPFPVEVNLNEAWNHKKWSLKSNEQVEMFFKEKINNPEYFWLVGHEKTINQNVPLNNHYLEEYLAKNYETLEYKHFRYMINVRYLKKKE